MLELHDIETGYGAGQVLFGVSLTVCGLETTFDHSWPQHWWGLVKQHCSSALPSVPSVACECMPRRNRDDIISVFWCFKNAACIRAGPLQMRNPP